MSEADSVEGRLAELVSQYGLSEHQRTQLAGLLEALARDPAAPTAIRSPQRAFDEHIADSLVAVELEPVRSAGKIVDVGSGAGFPGLPVAVALGSAHVHLLEGRVRNCAYLEQTAASLDVANTEVVCGRVEEWKAGLGLCDVVLARAVASQPVVLEYAAPLLGPDGLLVDWRGTRRPAEEEQALRAAHELGLRRVEVRKVQPFATARDRHLHLYLKAKETPNRFPRRVGMALKRPLGVRN